MNNKWAIDFWMAFGLLFTIGEHWMQATFCVVLAGLRIRDLARHLDRNELSSTSHDVYGNTKS